jgi:2-hydroxychromene-2-carboxylate isomerase
MAQQFEDQGGASNSNPSRLVRWITSRYLRRLANPARQAKQRAAIESQRLSKGGPHTVEYFHQVDDPYSYLAAQALQPLLDAYSIVLIPHLVSGPTNDNAPEPELLLDYARRDCALVAPQYGLEFNAAGRAPSVKRVALATRILATADASTFPQLALTVGRALWSADLTELTALKDRLGVASADAAQARVAEGSARQASLGHYSGAMFYYGKEWYWGVDRLYHLENRLISLQARHQPGHQLLMPRPRLETGPIRQKGALTLEFFPSLRSPYTSIIFDKTINLAASTGVTLVLRPVLPMVMRGVPATLEKGRYIISDTAREAESMGLEWGNVYDPIGGPVRRAYSLYPWARQQGKEQALLRSFLQAAWFDGVNTNSSRGLRQVVENAGLDWKQAQSRIGDCAWEEEFEANRLAMYAADIWGVPSYRLLNARGEALLECWGQDRLWLVARTIAQYDKEHSHSAEN